MARILYSVESVAGGIYTYARHQVSALSASGAEVTVLCREGTHSADFVGARVLARLPSYKAGLGPRRPVRYIRDARGSSEAIRAEWRRGYDLVLLDCLREYFAPFWTGPLKRLRSEGARIAVINHDPRRDFRVGPRCWQRTCLRAVYRTVSDIFVHGDVPMTDWSPTYANTIHCIPHGPLNIGLSKLGREDVRRRYRFEEDDFVILSFGQIRDGKQLDKLIRALSRVSRRVKLLVAGRVESASQRDQAYYLKLCLFSGVSDRVVWDYRYIPEDEVGGLFGACDAVATLYSPNFVSSSGVMSCAVAQSRPLLASGGDGPLKSALRQYPIGEWVNPGDLAAMGAAIDRLMEGRDRYSFEAFLRDHSWEKNAAGILRALDVSR